MKIGFLRVIYALVVTHKSSLLGIKEFSYLRIGCMTLECGYGGNLLGIR
jgi:hypothetical protein